MLGRPDRIDSYHGPVFRHPYAAEIDGHKYFQPGEPDENIAEDRLSYIFKDGAMVTLRFAIGAPGSKWEDEPFLGLVSGTTNDLPKLVPNPMD